MPETISPHEGDAEQEPVVVWDAANPMEAQIVKGRLQAEGIPAYVQGEAVGEIFGFTTGHLAETTVLVPESLAEKATKILNTDVEWDEEMLTDIEETGTEETSVEQASRDAESTDDAGIA